LRPSWNSSAALSSSCFRHCPIWFGWTPNLPASSPSVLPPRTAANATFALNEAPLRTRFPAIFLTERCPQHFPLGLKQPAIPRMDGDAGFLGLACLLPGVAGEEVHLTKLVRFVS